MSTNHHNQAQSTSESKQPRATSTTSQKLTTILDFNENPSKSTKINSPRSLQAIKKCHYSIEELYFLSIDQYKQANPETIDLSPELIRNRHEFHEHNRKQKITSIVNLRNDYINNNITQAQFSKTANNSQMNWNNSANNLITTSSAINNDRKELERMKAKNEMDLISMVQYEIKREIMQQKTQEKAKQEQEKAEKYKQELNKKHEIEEQRRQEKELEKQQRLLEEEEIQRKKEIERKEIEQRKKNEEAERERKRMIKIDKKRKMEEKKQQEFQQKVDLIMERHNKEIEDRQKELEIKEKERQRILEEKRIKKEQENLIKEQKKREMIECHQMNIEKEINEIQENYLEKQRQNELKKQEFEEKQKKLMQEKHMKSIAKAEEIQLILEKNKQIENERILLYNKKQQEIMNKKAKLEKELLIEQEKRKEKIIKNETKATNIIHSKEQEDEMKKSKILYKIEYRDIKTKEKQQEINMTNIQKREEQNIAKILKQEKITRIARADEAKREKLQEDLMIKNQRINEYHTQKQIILEQKKNMHAEIARKKDEYTSKFQSLMSKKSFNETSICALKEMFPDSKEIDDLIIEFKTKPMSNDSRKPINPPSTTHNKSKSRVNNIGQNALEPRFNSKVQRKTEEIAAANNNTHENPKSRSEATMPTIPSKKTLPTVTKEKKERKQPKPMSPNKKLTEKEIEEMVNDYKVTLNKELMKMLTYEREQEDLREEALNKLVSKKERQRMEMEFGKERAQASMRIINKNEIIERKIRDYETGLRNRIAK